MRTDLLWFSSALLAVLLLAACAVDPAAVRPDHEQTAPALQLVVHSHDGDVLPLGVTAAPVTVSAFPTLGVRVRDFTEVTSLHYRLDSGPWQLLGLDHTGRTTFIPELPLAEEVTRITVRAGNAAGEQTQISNDFRVDASPPVLTRVLLNSSTLLAHVGAGAVQLLEPVGTTSAHLSVRAEDGPYAGTELRVVLLHNGEVLAESDGGLLEYSFDLSEPAGVHGLSVYAVDAVGNRSGYVSFSVAAEQPEAEPEDPDAGPGDGAGTDD